MIGDLGTKGWAQFPVDPVLGDWLAHAIPAAKRAVADPAHRDWLRCGGTWFAGVNVLDNDAAGQVDGSGALAGQAIDAITQAFGPQEWDRAQVSVMYPGYPQPMAGESLGAFRYRLNRDAAHVDGLLPVGPERRRHLREPHGFILGLPLTDCDAGASPFVIWEGSHQVIRRALGAVLRPHPVRDWPAVDLTDAYHAARRAVFDTCPRVEIHAQAGAAYVAHRLALHGVAPWAEGAKAPPEGRMIAYFRPELRGPLSDWLDAD